MLRTRAVRIAVLGVVLTAIGTSGARAWDTSPVAPAAVTAQHHLCGSADLKEGAIQGDVPKADQDSGRAQKGYNCGLALLGYTSLGKDGRPNQNANMAWAGRCAYIAGSAGVNVAPQGKPSPPPGAGVAVVSVSDSGVPTYVATLRHPGSVATSETLNAVTTPSGRSVLVVGQYGNDIVSDPKPMDVYDVSNPDCAKSRYLGTYYWPNNIHNLTLSQDGRYVFATLPLQAADIPGLWDNDPKTGVRYLGNIEEAMDGPTIAMGPVADVAPGGVPGVTHPRDASHEAWASADGKTLYVGGQTPEFEMFSILDIGAWLQRNPDGTPKGKPRLISQTSSRGHSVRTAQIGKTPYILHSEESVFGAAYSCLPQETAPFAGPAQPWLTDISHPAHPRTVTQFGLEINDPSHCKDQLNAKENDSVHYHDVDDPNDTTFVMASMWNAGIRIFDVRRPARPTEVAYFNPGDVDPTSAVKLDQAWGHIRYIARSGQIWFATADGGFWVVQLESQVRNYLGLDAKIGRHGLPPVPVPRDDRGRPGTVGASLPLVTNFVDIARYYCTLGAATAPVSG